MIDGLIAGRLMGDPSRRADKMSRTYIVVTHVMTAYQAVRKQAPVSGGPTAESL